MEEVKFYYCEGQNCIKREKCPNYTEGKRIGSHLPGYWWQSSCDNRIPPVKEYVQSMGPIGKLLYYLGVMTITPMERDGAPYHKARRSMRWWNPLGYVIFLFVLMIVLLLAIPVTFAVSLVITSDYLFNSSVHMVIPSPKEEKNQNCKNNG